MSLGKTREERETSTGRDREGGRERMDGMGWRRLCNSLLLLMNIGQLALFFCTIINNDNVSSLLRFVLKWEILSVFFFVFIGQQYLHAFQNHPPPLPPIFVIQLLHTIERLDEAEQSATTMPWLRVGDGTQGTRHAVQSHRLVSPVDKSEVGVTE